MLRILQINMRSIRNIERFDTLKQFIDESNDMFDIIIVGESWLNDIHFSFYSIDGFHAYFSGRNGQQRGGGVAVYVRNVLESDILECFDNTFNSLWIKIKLSNGKLINLAAYYRPSWVNLIEFSTNLEMFIDKYDNDDCIIAGDLNLNMLDPNPNNDINTFANLLASYNLKFSNSIRTRKSRMTLLDLFITNLSDKFSITNHTIDNDFSDHSLILSEVNIQTNVNRIIDNENVSNTQIDYDILREKSFCNHRFYRHK